jgi:hypothetical protein
MALLLDRLADRLTPEQSLAQIREHVAAAEDILDLESAEWAESLIDRRPEFTG